MLGDIFMKCPKCRLHNSNSAKFCNECGFDFRTIDHLSAHTFGHIESYTPQHLVDKILTSRSSIEGERKYVTVMFVDVANSTSIFENLDPEAVHQIMDGCFQIFLDEVHKYEGTINQFRGDCVMAIFGAPIAHEDHAQRACHAALGIIGAIKDYRRLVEQKHKIPFEVRIGLNTGQVVVGSIGNDLRMDYTADGDTTNLASRMESNAKQGTILISPNTYKLIDKLFKTRSLGEISVKGKKDPLNVYELLDEKVYRQRVGIERQIYSEMVGREDEILRLERQVEKLINGSGSVVNIIGEAGIGKSRLVAELKNHDVMEKVTLLEGKAISIGKNLSFYPIIDLLKHWAGIKEEDGQVTAFEKLEASIKALKTGQTDEILPFIATLMGIKLSGEHAQRVKGIEGEALENLLFKNFRELLIQIAKYSPVVVVIEDLHWADLSSIGFLESIFQLAQRNPILFINPIRPGYEQTAERLITTLNEDLKEYYLEMTLAPLDVVSSEALIDNMLNVKGLPVSLINQIVERTDGNPYFIEEVVRSFIDEGVLVGKDGIFKSTDKIHQVVIPNTINDLLTARIDRLEDKNRELLKIASVIGRNFFYRILKNVAESGLDIDKRLAYLKNIQMIFERQRLKEIEYLFTHALAQEAAYESILMEKRKPLHLNVAQSIEKLFFNKLHEFYGILSFHYTKGEDFFKAEEYLIKSGEEALKSSASSEAVTFFREALSLYQNRLGENADPDKIAYMQKCIALAYYNRGQMMESTEYFGHVLNYHGIKTSKSGYGYLKGFFSFTLFIVYLYIQIFKSNKKASKKDNEIVEMWFRKTLAFSLTDRVMFIKEGFSFFRLLSSFDLKTLDNGVTYLMSAAAFFIYGGVSFALANKVLKRIKSDLSEDDVRCMLYYLTISMLLDFFSGNFAGKIDIDEELVIQNLELGDVTFTTFYFNQFIFQYIEKGKFNETIDLIHKEFDIIETYRINFSKSLLLALNTRLLLKMRKLNEALMAADSGIAYAKDAGDLIVLSQIHSYKARIQLLSGNIEGAEHSLENAEKIKSDMMLHFYLIEMHLSRFAIELSILEHNLTAKGNKVLRVHKKRVFKCGKIAAKITQKVKYNSVELFRYIGIYHWITNKQRKALRYWSKSITEGERMDAKPELARTYSEVGIRLLDQTSEQEELNGIGAEEYIEKARNIFEDLGLQWDLEQLDRFTSNI